MAQHEVKISQPVLEIQNADVEFSIRRDGEKLGTLKISKGNIEWVPYRNTYGVTMDWADFAEMMETQGEPVA